MRTKLAVMTVMTLAALAGRVLAHEGHEHKIMGKVVAIDEKTIAVESLDGKKVTGMLVPSTKDSCIKNATKNAKRGQGGVSNAAAEVLAVFPDGTKSSD